VVSRRRNVLSFNRKCSISQEGRVVLFSKKTELQRTTLTSKPPMIDWRKCVDPHLHELAARFPQKSGWFEDITAMFQSHPRAELNSLCKIN
jgi:hypothetical protein